MIVTSALSAGFFLGQVSRLKEAGYRVSIICSAGIQTTPILAEGADIFAVAMEREISVFKDLASLWKLWQLLRRIRPDITNVGTPKAGLLGGVAARLAGVPHRIYTLHGLRLESATGWKRQLLIILERIACGNAHYVRCVSASLRANALALGLVRPDQAVVIGAGTANGVDTAHFRRTPQRMAEAQQLRRTLGIPAGALVIGFVGRFTRDKGIAELYSAFVRLKTSHPTVRMLLVGGFEEGDPVDAAVRRAMETEPNVIFTGVVPDTAPYYRLMDMLALPSLREGLPTVSIEAQASGVPVVTTSATGAVDSILAGVSGMLVPARNEEALADALYELLSNPEKRAEMGDAAVVWVNERFRRDLIWQDLIADYDRLSEIREGHPSSAAPKGLL